MTPVDVLSMMKFAGLVGLSVGAAVDYPED